MSNSTPRHQSYRWTFDQIFRKLYTDQTYSSVPFTLSSFTSASSPAQYELKVIINGANYNYDTKDYYLSVGLYDAKHGEPCLLRCQFSLIDCEGQKRNTQEMFYYFAYPKCLHPKLDRFMTLNELYDSAYGFCRNSRLTVDCQITILGEPSSVGYFDSFVSDLNFISQSNPDLMAEVFESLALKHKANEFPECMPLDLPFDVPVEETLTHHAKYSLSKTLFLENGFFGQYTWAVRCWENPDIKFSLNWNRILDHDKFEYCCGLYISYLSAPSIFVDVTLTRKEGLLPWQREPDTVIDHLSGELTQVSNSLRIDCKCIYTNKGQNIFIDLKMTIYKQSYRKSGFPEMKSLSYGQTLMDLKTLVDCGKHCDVVLLVEGKQFRASKAILVAQSPVFEAMFRFNWIEAKENCVEVHDVKVEAFEQFLLYLYTGKVDSEILKIHAMNVFVLADMHYLSTLQEMCLRVFGQSLTPESVAEQFELADRLGLIEFKQVCTDYMNKTN